MKLNLTLNMYFQPLENQLLFNIYISKCCWHLDQFDRNSILNQSQKYLRSIDLCIPYHLLFIWNFDQTGIDKMHTSTAWYFIQLMTQYPSHITIEHRHHHHLTLKTFYISTFQYQSLFCKRKRGRERESEWERAIDR